MNVLSLNTSSHDEVDDASHHDSHGAQRDELRFPPFVVHVHAQDQTSNVLGHSAFDDECLDYDQSLQSPSPQTSSVFEIARTEQMVLARERPPSSNTKRFKCHICGKRFKENYKLRYHLNFHYGTKTHCCSYCNNAFTTTSALNNHEMTKHLQQLIAEKLITGCCTHCNKYFRSENKLMSHILTCENPVIERVLVGKEPSVLLPTVSHSIIGDVQPRPLVHKPPTISIVANVTHVDRQPKRRYVRRINNNDPSMASQANPDSLGNEQTRPRPSSPFFPSAEIESPGESTFLQLRPTSTGEIRTRLKASKAPSLKRLQSTRAPKHSVRVLDEKAKPLRTVFESTGSEQERCPMSDPSRNFSECTSLNEEEEDDEEEEEDVDDDEDDEDNDCGSEHGFASQGLKPASQAPSRDNVGCFFEDDDSSGPVELDKSRGAISSLYSAHHLGSPSRAHHKLLAPHLAVDKSSSAQIQRTPTNSHFIQPRLGSSTAHILGNTEFRTFPNEPSSLPPAVGEANPIYISKSCIRSWPKFHPSSQGVNSPTYAKACFRDSATGLRMQDAPVRDQFGRRVTPVNVLSEHVPIPALTNHPIVSSGPSYRGHMSGSDKLVQFEILRKSAGSDPSFDVSEFPYVMQTALPSQFTAPDSFSRTRCMPVLPGFPLPQFQPFPFLHMPQVYPLVLPRPAVKKSKPPPLLLPPCLPGLQTDLLPIKSEFVDK